jgi:hypothetical protein
MKKSNNLLVRNLKLAVLTIAMGFMATGKVSAQQNQNNLKLDVLGPQKSTLNRQDSVCIASVCSPKSKELLKDMVLCQDSLDILLTECQNKIGFIKKESNGKYSQEALETFKELDTISNTIIKAKDRYNITISRLLDQSFNVFVRSPGTLKVFSVPGKKDEIVVTGTAINDSKGNTFFVSPGYTNAKEVLFNCKYISR